MLQISKKINKMYGVQVPKWIDAWIDAKKQRRKVVYHYHIKTKGYFNPYLLTEPNSKESE